MNGFFLYRFSKFQSNLHFLIASLPIPSQVKPSPLTSLVLIASKLTPSPLTPSQIITSRLKYRLILILKLIIVKLNHKFTHGPWYQHS